MIKLCIKQWLVANPIYKTLYTHNSSLIEKLLNNLAKFRVTICDYLYIFFTLNFDHGHRWLQSMNYRSIALTNIGYRL